VGVVSQKSSSVIGSSFIGVTEGDVRPDSGITLNNSLTVLFDVSSDSSLNELSVGFSSSDGLSSTGFGISDSFSS
jgi:hypothetical protein